MSMPEELRDLLPFFVQRQALMLRTKHAAVHEALGDTVPAELAEEVSTVLQTFWWHRLQESIAFETKDPAAKARARQLLRTWFYGETT